ncbi:MAG: trypsin-like serine protease [Dolichospermum sp. LBC05a]|nr:GUN4 domain-containing protein [Dolichospermum sp. OL01]MCO5799205.1 GUN4 domain-containing protein [Dolichospermum sp. OL03]MCS6280328.1 GUN4 domain-containing protein [Dolichospermum sp.]QSV60577.1 MAG: trypsin-like serine protease [Dolichospermum sp. LBC05a]
MKFSQGLGVILGTTTLALVQYQPVFALTSVQVNDIAKPITVMIGGLDGKGSGVIIAKNGNTYTVLTANHVVKKAGYGIYELITHDGQKYPMESARPLGKLDLALVRFTSSKNYPLAKIADSRTVKEGATVYYAGFPAETANQPRNYRFIRADITGRSQNQEGYELSYNGSALPGMSGGPVLNEEGLLIAIHGKAETQSIIIQGVQRTEIVGVQGIPTEKFSNLISNIPDNPQANTPRNNPSPRTESKPVTLANTPRNPSPTNEPTPAIFQNLETLLQAGKWRDADLETWNLMKKLTKREQEGWLRLEDVKNFPRQELRKMDQLWVKYSNGKLGFSVQKQIWLDLGGKLDGEPDWDTLQKLGSRVGWRQNNEWLSYDSYTFSTNALPGHLPARRIGGWGDGGSVGGGVEVGSTLFSSLDYNP